MRSIDSGSNGGLNPARLIRQARIELMASCRHVHVMRIGITICKLNLSNNKAVFSLTFKRTKARHPALTSQNNTPAMMSQYRVLQIRFTGALNTATIG